MDTAADILDRLGGNAPVAEALGVHRKAPDYWRKINRFPPHLRRPLGELAVANGVEVPDELFEFKRKPYQHKEARDGKVAQER